MTWGNPRSTRGYDGWWRLAGGLCRGRSSTCLCPSCYDYTHLLVGRGADGNWKTQAELDSLEEADAWYAAEVKRMAERAPA